jgi:4-hydroxy-tetrahydrodipicolinate reductase
MIRVAINGAAGRMGRRLVDLVSHEEDMSVVAALEHPGHAELRRDAGELAGRGHLGVPLAATWAAATDVLIDFSVPAGAMPRILEGAQKGVALVIGTTGFTGEEQAQIAEAARRAPVLYSPNMSVGVNLLFRLAAEVAAALGEEYDIEIIEAHHRFKKDAPSGTALRIAEEIAAATGRNLAKAVVYGRHGASAERKPGEIGIHAVRAGDIVGDHTVIFSGLGERVEVVHRAESRDTFVRGAIRAARFLVGKKPGMYAMGDVLGGHMAAHS